LIRLEGKDFAGARRFASTDFVRGAFKGVPAVKIDDNN
jgi:hypothetical protein